MKYFVSEDVLNNPYQTEWTLLGRNGNGPAAQGLVKMMVDDRHYLEVTVHRGHKGTDGSPFVDHIGGSLVSQEQNRIVGYVKADDIVLVRISDWKFYEEPGTDNVIAVSNSIQDETYPDGTVGLIAGSDTLEQVIDPAIPFGIVWSFFDRKDFGETEKYKPITEAKARQRQPGLFAKVLDVWQGPWHLYNQGGQS